jgi:voltage-gated potassium channel
VVRARWCWPSRLGDDHRTRMSPSSLEDLQPRERRRAIARAGARMTATTVALFVLYAVIPVAGESGARALIELIAGLVVFGGILIWLALSIVKADLPEVRAVEALIVAVVILITVFAYTYLSLSRGNAASFTEPLDHASSVYFTVTTLGTVGYGDIAGKTEAARILITIQILLDLVVLIAIARAVLFAARFALRRPSGE